MPDLLSASFRVSADYMPSNTDGVDPYVTTMQWSRRFLGLRLFMSLAAAGWTGHARHVERAVALAAELEKALRDRRWVIANHSPVAVVCAEPPPGSTDIRTLVGRVLASGTAWVSRATFEQRPVIRACVTNAETGLKEVMALVDALEAARH